MSTTAIEYNSELSFIQSGTTIDEKIIKVDSIITALEDLMVTAATSDNIQEYWLDDGQTKIKTIYRSIEQIERSIAGMDRYRSRLVNKRIGRVVPLVDGKNLR